MNGARCVVARNRLDSHSDRTIDSKRRGVNGRTRLPPEDGADGAVIGWAERQRFEVGAVYPDEGEVVDHVEGHDVASQARAVAEFDGRCVESDQYVGIGGDQVSAHREAAAFGGAPQAIPVTRTVDLATSWRTSAERPSLLGGGPGSGGDANGGRPAGGSPEVSLPHPLPARRRQAGWTKAAASLRKQPGVG